MSDIIETVKVVTEQGYKIINKSDLAPGDVIYGGKAPKKRGKK